MTLHISGEPKHGLGFFFFTVFMDHSWTVTNLEQLNIFYKRGPQSRMPCPPTSPAGETRMLDQRLPLLTWNYNQDSNKKKKRNEKWKENHDCTHWVCNEITCLEGNLVYFFFFQVALTFTMRHLGTGGQDRDVSFFLFFCCRQNSCFVFLPKHHYLQLVGQLFAFLQGGGSNMSRLLCLKKLPFSEWGEEKTAEQLLFSNPLQVLQQYHMSSGRKMVVILLLLLLFKILFANIQHYLDVRGMASGFISVFHTLFVKSYPLNPNLSFHQEAEKQQIYKWNVKKRKMEK